MLNMTTSRKSVIDTLTLYTSSKWDYYKLKKLNDASTFAYLVIKNYLEKQNKITNLFYDDVMVEIELDPISKLQLVYLKRESSPNLKWRVKGIEKPFERFSTYTYSVNLEHHLLFTEEDIDDLENQYIASQKETNNNSDAFQRLITLINDIIKERQARAIKTYLEITSDERIIQWNNGLKFQVWHGDQENFRRFPEGVCDEEITPDLFWNNIDTFILNALFSDSNVMLFYDYEFIRFDHGLTDFLNPKAKIKCHARFTLLDKDLPPGSNCIETFNASLGFKKAETSAIYNHLSLKENTATLTLEVSDVIFK